MYTILAMMLATFPCMADADCDDSSTCTIDSCVWGQCRYKIACDDGDICTDDACVAGVCEHKPSGIRHACGTSGYCHRGECCEGAWLADEERCVDSCDDGNWCTADVPLAYGECVRIPPDCPGLQCVCENDSDCQTGDACMQSGCFNGTCVHQLMCGECSQ